MNSSAHSSRSRVSLSCNGESNVEILRKCFSRRFIKGMGNLLYTTFFSATTINLRNQKTITYESMDTSDKNHSAWET